MIHRRTLLASSLAIPLLAQAGASRADTCTVVADAPCGPVTGLGGCNGVTAFLGVPYAQPPLGALRYASPRPLPRWDTPQGGAFGPPPIQTLAGAAAWLYEPTPNQSEDCLTLNVWTPDPRGQRPVMVWLHGGAWRTGHGGVAGTRGAALAALGDVVVVTVNYRLGVLGWLAHPELADPETGAAANWGLQDQVAALRWVQANIAAFGGDPGRVTLFGQSAGGSSTASIAQDPRHAGLLHRAIIQSGSLHGAPGFPEMATAATYAEALAHKLATTIPGLRAVPAIALHRAELDQARDPAMTRALGRPPVLPVLDGTVLRAWPRDAALAPVPLLIGTTRTEGTFWYDLVNPDGSAVPGLRPPATAAELPTYIADLAALYRPEAAGRAAALAPIYLAGATARGDLRVMDAWVDAYTDIVFRLRARTAAMRHAAAGHPVTLYEFAHALAAPARGVPHTAEIPFAFGTYADPFFATKMGTGPAEVALSGTMLRAWAQFAHDGAVPGWAPVSATTVPVNVLGGPDGAHALVPAVRPEALTAWNA